MPEGATPPPRVASSPSPMTTPMMSPLGSPLRGAKLAPSGFVPPQPVTAPVTDVTDPEVSGITTWNSSCSRV